MSDQDRYGSGGILQWYMQTLAEKIADNKFKGKEKVLAERALDQMRAGDLMRTELMEKIADFNSEAAEEFERCLRILLHSAYVCGAFVTSLETSENAALSKNIAQSRNGRQEKRKARDAILDRDLPRLIDSGFGGESLRSNLEKLFKKEGISEDLSNPSLSLVQTWKRNYKNYKNWRPAQRER